MEIISIESQLPLVEDHYHLTILVQQFGVRSLTLFNRLIERLRRINCLQVSDNPKRVISINFISTISSLSTRFGELQAFRRILGLIGVVHIPNNKSSEFINDYGSEGTSTQPYSSSDSFLNIKAQYESCKAELGSMLVDSCCIVLCNSSELGSELDETWKNRELLHYDCLENANMLENSVRDFIRAIFFVLESKRLDLSYEALENPPCPSVFDEKKYRFGLDMKGTKLYRKKCIGRMRKQIADYTLMTGLPVLALDAYQSSIEALKEASDLLWLAAALEGWACCALIMKLDLVEKADCNSAFQRASTESRLNYTRSLKISDKPSNKWYRSVRGKPLVYGMHDGISEDQRRRFMGLPLPRLLDMPERKLAVTYVEVMERFRAALENYERFSFAASIEYECMMRGASTYRYQGLYLELESFIRENIGKYLDDNYTIFNNNSKSNICLHASTIYRLIGFRRKYAFFARLAVLFQLHPPDGEPKTVSDYRHVYPILYRSLIGYGIREYLLEISDDISLIGPVHIQQKALHEVFMSAVRAEYHDAAVRHLCYMFQVYFEYMDFESVVRLLDDIFCFVSVRKDLHYLNQHIAIANSDIIIPPLQMTRFPHMQNFSLSPLPVHLAPSVIWPQTSSDVFIYSPFQNNAKSENVTRWVVNCAGEVSVWVKNYLPFELSVHNLTLLSEGCSLETVPVRLSLAASTDSNDFAQIKLISVPRSPGKLSIIGYSCEVLGVKNICRFREKPGEISVKGIKRDTFVFNVEVLPALPVLQLDTSLPRAPISEDDLELTAELTVYSGQTFEHTISIVNTNDTIGVVDVVLEAKQPKVCGGPCLIEVVKSWNGNDLVVNEMDKLRIEPRRIGPLERRHIKFKIFGIDASAATDDSSISGKSDHEVNKNDANHVTELTQDRIPFTGRLLTSEFVFHYKADFVGVDGQEYQRHCRLPLAVCIMPAVTVTAWNVLPGDGPTTRYVLVDVTNSTAWEAELLYGEKRVIGVQPKEICRIPLLCRCCSNVSHDAFDRIRSLPSHVMQVQAMERLRRILELHVSSHLDIKWSISSINLHGSVPIGPLLSSLMFLKQLIVPAISFEMNVNDVPYVSEDDIVTGIGEIVQLDVKLISSLRDNRLCNGILQLRCYRDLQSDNSHLDANDSVIILGAECVPFSACCEEIRGNEEMVSIEPLSIANDYSPPTHDNTNSGTNTQLFTTICDTTFFFMFRYEGCFKVKPMIKLFNESEALREETLCPISKEQLLCSAVSFSVVTKNS